MSMKIIFLSLIFTLFLISPLLSQNDEKIYDSLVRVAKNYFELKDYQSSANSFSKAFQANGWKANPYSRYYAVCAWSLANVPDSAFNNLIIYVNEVKYFNYEKLNSDSDLFTLHSDKRWKNIKKQVERNKKQKEKYYNWKIIKQLNQILKDDQYDRSQLEVIENKYGRKSSQVDSLWRLIEIKDSINLLKVTTILDKYGWLSPKIIGDDGGSTIFLVIQHAELKTQEKYLPIMRIAGEKGELDLSYLAMLEDRVALRQGKPQIYGTQISYDETNEVYFLSPVDDPDNLDKRRAKYNLDPIYSYVIEYDIIWDVDEYKKNLPYYMSIEWKN